MQSVSICIHIRQKKQKLKEVCSEFYSSPLFQEIFQFLIALTIVSGLGTECIENMRHKRHKFYYLFNHH
jgi:hypothetical protein